MREFVVVVTRVVVVGRNRWREGQSLVIRSWIKAGPVSKNRL